MLLGITTEGKIWLALLAGAFIVFAILSAFVFPRRDPNFPGNRLGLFVAVTVALFAATMAGVVVFAKEEEGAHAEATGGEHAEADPGVTTPEGEPTDDPAETTTSGDAEAGEAVFASAGCAACHTLAAAGASGSVGPNLDESRPDAELVEDRVRNGKGAMPAYEGQLDDEQIADVTAFVVESTSG